MNRITKSLLGSLISATILFSLISISLIYASEPCSAFQFSIKNRRSSPGRQPHKPVYSAPKKSTASHFAYRQRSLKASNRTNRIPYTAGFYSFPLYGGNQYSPLSRSAISRGNYPSNITAYDAEFRNSRRPAAGTNVSQTGVNQTPGDLTPDLAPTPATIANQHFQNSPQQIVNSHFDLQQRLLGSRATPLIKSTPAASNLQGHAEKAFREGSYNDAAYYCDQAVKADPYNGLMHLFCSQCNFAIGKYSIAIQMLEKATGLLHQSQWGYIAGHYETFYGQDDYVAHTRSLADYLKRRQDDNRARTLLGYHYGCLGYKTTASKLFHQSLQTYPNDELAQRLIPIFGDADYASTVVKQIQAPTPDLLDEPTAIPMGVEQAYGNRVIYLTPEQTVLDSPIEELPAPEEMFFNEESSAESVLIPALESPR